MAKRLIITEKPSVARDIVAVDAVFVRLRMVDRDWLVDGHRLGLWRLADAHRISIAVTNHGSHGTSQPRIVLPEHFR